MTFKDYKISVKSHQITQRSLTKIAGPRTEQIVDVHKYMEINYFLVPSTVLIH